MAESKLFVLTHYYPFGNADTSFMKEEVRSLSKQFDKIYLLPLFKNSDVIDDLPPNVALEYDFINLKVPRPPLGLRLLKAWLHTFTGDMKRNAEKISFYKNLKHNTALFFQLYSKYLLFEKYMEKHSEKKKNLYTFWFDEWTTVCSLYKMKNKQSTLFSRAHGFDLYEERSKASFIPFRSFQLENVDKLFAISKHGLSYLREKYPAYISKYHLSYLGSEDTGINYDLKKEQIPKIISCSNFAPVKRVHLIIETLKQVKIPIHWIHFGGGKDLDRLKDLCKELPPHIQFTFKGDIPHHELLKYHLQNYTNLFINVSISEGLPISLMEAASFGIPMIATDVGGVSEIVNSKTGILLRPDFAPHELAQIIDTFPASELANEDFRKNIRKFWETHFNSKQNSEFFAKELSAA